MSLFVLIKKQPPMQEDTGLPPVQPDMYWPLLTPGTGVLLESLGYALGTGGTL